MIIKGNRRGGAVQLADHILSRENNEDVMVKEISNYPANSLHEQHLRNALNLMAVQGEAKGKSRIFYHSIIAPQAGEILNAEQLKYAVDTLAKNLGMESHQRIIVEHRKAGRQHFHVVFNILDPVTGKQARLQWTRKKEWNTARQLEKELGLKPVIAKGRPARQWEAQRGKRSGIDPLKVRKEVTAIYQASKTGKEFILNLDKAGYVLSRGRNNSYVIVDKAGDIHGLMRRIEGAKLKDLRAKFPDLKDQSLPLLSSVLKQRKPIVARKAGAKYNLRLMRWNVKRAYRSNGDGRSFLNVLNRNGYAFEQQGNRSFIIDSDGNNYSLDRILGKKEERNFYEKYPNISTLPQSRKFAILHKTKIGTGSGSVTPLDAAFIATLLKRNAHDALQRLREDNAPRPSAPISRKKGWPPEAVADWKAWGHRDPARFFAKWPELAPVGFSPGGKSND